MMMDTINVGAERRQAVARRADEANAERRRAQARRILSGEWGVRSAQWNASRVELKDSIAAKYTKMSRADRRALLDAALEVQRTERPKIDPSEVHTRAPVPERLARRVPKRAPKPAPQAPKEDREMPARIFTNEQAADARAWLRGWRAANPAATSREGKAAFEARFGVSLGVPGFQVSYWRKAEPAHGANRSAATEKKVPVAAPASSTGVEKREEAWDNGPAVHRTAPAAHADGARAHVKADPVHANGGSPAISNGTRAHRPADSAPVQPVAAAVSEIAGGERELRASEQLREAERQIAQLLHEVRSLRGEYEAGDFVRMEGDGDVWMLRASLTFPDARTASRVAAHLFAATATLEEVTRA